MDILLLCCAVMLMLIVAVQTLKEGKGVGERGVE
jgi:hypothetical protein